MRLFCGIEIPARIRAGLEALVGRMRPLAKLSWSPIEKLHVTTNSSANGRKNGIDGMNQALAGVPRPGPIEIAVRGCGVVSERAQSARILGRDRAGRAIEQLARDTDQAWLRHSGWSPKDREFHPHLTLARRRDPVPIERLRKELAAIGSPTISAAFRAESFFLYLSRGGRYIKLAGVPALK